MTILLDSHAFVWFASGNPRCSERARNAIESADTVYVSAVTSWELATKARLGKWPEAEPYVERLADVIAFFAFQPLPMTVEAGRLAGWPAGRLAGTLASPHKDPFDRILAAQAQIGALVVATADRAFESLGVRVVW